MRFQIEQVRDACPVPASSGSRSITSYYQNPQLRQLPQLRRLPAHSHVTLPKMSALKTVFCATLQTKQMRLKRISKLAMTTKDDKSASDNPTGLTQVLREYDREGLVEQPSSEPASANSTVILQTPQVDAAHVRSFVTDCTVSRIASWQESAVQSRHLSELTPFDFEAAETEGNCVAQAQPNIIYKIVSLTLKSAPARTHAIARAAMV